MKQLSRICQNKNCGTLFIPCPQVPRQKYCSKKECQQARKNEWNRKKFASDPDYREYKRAAQDKRKRNNPNYWKEYRARNPVYTQKNRQQQRLRNQKRQKLLSEPVIATPDESTFVNPVASGIYKMTLVHSDIIATPDEYIVEIAAIADG